MTINQFATRFAKKIIFTVVGEAFYIAGHRALKTTRLVVSQHFLLSQTYSFVIVDKGVARVNSHTIKIERNDVIVYV